MLALCQLPVATAQEPQNRAESLFTEGRAALDAGKYDVACAKFQASLEIVTRASTLVNLAQCEERVGKLAAALRHWKEGSALLDAQDERRKPAEQRMAELDKRVPRVTVKLPADAPAAARVILDGVELGPDALTGPIAVDPGEHALSLVVAGKEGERARVPIAEGEHKDVALSLGSAPKPAGPALKAAPSEGPAGPKPPADAPPDGGGSTQRTLGLVAGGLGIAGLVAAGVTGGMLLSRDGSIDEGCPDKRCTQEAYDMIDGSKTLIAVNYVAWGVGIAGVAAGAVLLLTSGSGDPPKTAVAPVILPGGGGLAMRRAF